MVENIPRWNVKMEPFGAWKWAFWVRFERIRSAGSLRRRRLTVFRHATLTSSSVAGLWRSGICGNAADIGSSTTYVSSWQYEIATRCVSLEMEAKGNLWGKNCSAIYKHFHSYWNAPSAHRVLPTCVLWRSLFKRFWFRIFWRVTPGQSQSWSRYRERGGARMGERMKDSYDDFRSTVEADKLRARAFILWRASGLHLEPRKGSLLIAAAAGTQCTLGE